ncbi:MAG TPA: ABC transporter ATP-binding protein [Leucothrix sp.]|nr:ABC transporter ATP-binding protein [Leucothrix sp.]
MVDKPLKKLDFTHVKKSFGRGKQTKSILKDTQISLKQGECTLLSGKNGSGKSTLLRILAGLIKADVANISINEQSLSHKQIYKLIRQHVMYLYQEPYMFDGSVTRNLGYALKSKSTDKVKQALQWADLEHRKDTEAKCLSGGEKQRLALAQAWLKQPSILLLDEPTANMDKHAKRRTGKLLSEFKEVGITLLIASHDLDHLLQIMDRRLILENGKLLKVNKYD